MRIRAYISGAWKDVAVFIAPLSATAAPSVIDEIIIGAGTIITPPVTVTPAGGLAPYTYSCVRVSGTGGTVTNPTSATTSFRRAMGNGEVVTNVFRWTVTDALSSTTTADVTVNFTSEATGGVDP